MCLMLSAALSEEGRGEEENKEGVYLYQEILQGLIDGLIRYEGRGTAKFLAASTVLEYGMTANYSIQHHNYRARVRYRSFGQTNVLKTIVQHKLIPPPPPVRKKRLHAQRTELKAAWTQYDINNPVPHEPPKSRVITGTAPSTGINHPLNLFLAPAPAHDHHHSQHPTRPPSIYSFVTNLRSSP